MGKRRSQTGAAVLVILTCVFWATACQTDPLGTSSGPGIDSPVETGNSQIVAGRTKVALIGALAPGSEYAARVSKCRWRQTDGTGVEIADPTSMITSFIAPALAQGRESLTFELEVVAGDALFTAAHEVIVLAAADHGLVDPEDRPADIVSHTSDSSVDPGGGDGAPAAVGFTIETDDELTVFVDDFVQLEAWTSTLAPAKRVQWRQIAGNLVELFDADTLTPSFYAPPSRATLLFRVTGYTEDAIRAADVTVHVQPRG